MTNLKKKKLLDISISNLLSKKGSERARSSARQSGGLASKARLKLLGLDRLLRRNP